MDLITRAGGAAPGRGSVAYVFRATEPGEGEGSGGTGPGGAGPITVDLNRLLDSGDLSVNVGLVSGDTVYIPMDARLNPSRSKVYVEGRVKRPCVVDFQPGLGALAAVIMAGGFHPWAAPARTRIIRPGGDGQTVIRADLEKVAEGTLPDFPLEPGDRVHVPESWW
jgi:polysaccharide export outer membrane protein